MISWFSSCDLQATSGIGAVYITNYGARNAIMSVEKQINKNICFCETIHFLGKLKFWGETEK